MSSIELIRSVRLRFVRCRDDERGTTAIEYALLLATVAAGLLLTLDFANDFLPGKFSTVAAHLGPGPTATGAMPSSRNDETPTAVQRIVALAHQADDRLRVPLLICLVVPLALLWRRLRRLRKSPQPDAADEHVEAAPVPEQVQARFVAKRQQMLRVLSHDMRQLVAGPMEVQQLMTQPVSSVLPSTPVEDVAAKLGQLEVRHMPVCSSDGQLLGVVSDRDVRAARGKTAGVIMTAAPLTVEPRSQVKPAVTMMLERRISSLPVVDNGQLVGILTTTDLVMALQCTMQLVQSIAADLLPSDQAGPAAREPVANDELAPLAV